MRSAWLSPVVGALAHGGSRPSHYRESTAHHDRALAVELKAFRSKSKDRLLDDGTSGSRQGCRANGRTARFVRHEQDYSMVILGRHACTLEPENSDSLRLPKCMTRGNDVLDYLPLVREFRFNNKVSEHGTDIAF